MSKGLESPYMNLYYLYMKDMAIEMGADKKQAKKEMLDTVNFEIQMANVIYAI